ncbi:S8 family serine peptidase [Leucobacter sp.]
MHRTLSPAGPRRRGNPLLRALLAGVLSAGVLLSGMGPAWGGADAAALASSSDPATVNPAVTDAIGALQPEEQPSPFAFAGWGADEAALEAGADVGSGTGDADQPAADEGAEDPDASGTSDEDWVDRGSGRVELIVYFADAGVAPAAQGDPELASSSLQSAADARWERVDSRLRELERSGRVEVLGRFWVAQSILVSADASDATLAALAALPGATEITPNYTVEPLEETAPEAVEAEVPVEEAAPLAAEGETSPPNTYGIERINAHEAWRDFGVRGEGVRVAVLDTGVDATHPEIGSRLVGRGTGDPSYPGGWMNFDRLGNPLTTKPTDPGSHGTHVAGTIVGGASSGTQIGVAPSAELMAANVLSGGGSTAKIYAALEWAMSPYDGSGRPAGRAADVINMSLGSGGFDARMATAIQNVRDAGIFPAIAIGNSGANTTSAPGNFYNAVGVGMTDADDAVSSGSSGGTVSWSASVAEQFGWPASYTKPDVSAPGVAVFSAMPGGLYGNSSGTSMATPHVAGAAALIKSAQGGLTVSQIQDALEQTAHRPGEDQGAVYPDTRYGHGRIDVHAAISLVQGQSGVKGVLTDSATGRPVSGATVSYAERGETWTTDAQGRFTARLVPGEYTLAITRFGYEDATTARVAVREGSFAQVQVRMKPITVGSIAGTVLDHASGTPIEGAVVAVMGQDISTTTAADGSYRLTGLPAGEYRLRASAPGKRELLSGAAPVLAALETTVGFRLADLNSVLVLNGLEGDRTATLLEENGFLVAHAASLAAAPAPLDSYDAVVWDTPLGGASAAEVEAAIAATDASGTGVVWLDLGRSADSGIGTLHSRIGNPASRETADDRTAAEVAYRVTREHPIFAGGLLSPDALGVGGVIVQNSANGSKSAAWFDGLTGTAPTVIAESIYQHADPDDDRARIPTALGSGIAVDERANNRHVLLALHGSSNAVDARNWSPAAAQVMLNAVTWVSPAEAQAPEPQIVVPEPPVVPPGDGGNNQPGDGGNGSPTDGPGGSGTGQRPQEPAPDPTPGAPTATGGSGSRAPSAQSLPKPTFTPEPPVATANQLTRANSGDIVVRVEDGIAHVTIPGSRPGDWFFLHVYPSKTPVDWIRVNDDGELRIDVARLSPGTYRFAFTSAKGDFAGWVAVEVPGTPRSASNADDPEGAGIDDDPLLLTDEQLGEPRAAGLSLSGPEQLMLLGAALLILCAAGVVLFGTRRAPSQSGAAATSTPGAASAPAGGGP